MARENRAVERHIVSGRRNSVFKHCFFCLLVAAASARGTIVGGSNGAQNTTAPDGFLYWNNIGYVPFGTGDVGGTGIYLGDRWVLTANHVQGGSNGGYTFVIPNLNNGQNAVFTPQFASQRPLTSTDGNAFADIALFRLQDDPLLHGLPNVQFGATPTVGTGITVTGEGYNRAPELRYWLLADPNQPDSTTWTDVTGLPSQSMAQRRGYFYAPGFAKRWGSNQTVTVPGGGATFEFNHTQLIASVFDEGAVNDSQLAPGDSGGGVFVNNRLVGLSLYKGDDSKDPNNPANVGQPTNTAVFGNASFYANLHNYVNQIVGITGVHPSIDGDANLDGLVDRSDFELLYANLGTGTTWTQGDFNLDGKVDFVDFQRLELNFGQSSFSAVSTQTNAGAMAVVPEPGGLGILAALAGLGARRSGRRVRNRSDSGT